MIELFLHINKKLKSLKLDFFSRFVYTNVNEKKIEINKG